LNRLPPTRPRADRLERIGKIGPAGFPIDARGGGERPGLPLPPVHRMLGCQDLLGAHSSKPIVARVELADMIEAVPTIIARPVLPAREGRGAGTGRTKFARLGAAGGIARAAPIGIAPVESIVLHPFHMALDRLEGKPCPNHLPTKFRSC
jgi:hypothetical protein